jgi:hypothetical protein
VRFSRREILAWVAAAPLLAALPWPKAKAALKATRIPEEDLIHPGGPTEGVLPRTGLPWVARWSGSPKFAAVQLYVRVKTPDGHSWAFADLLDKQVAQDGYPLSFVETRLERAFRRAA